MNLKYLNPFFMYLVAFLLSMALYHMKLSQLYSISGPYIEAMILITIFLSFILAFIFRVTTKSMFKRDYVEATSKKNSYVILFFLVIGSATEYAYSKSIPLLSLLQGSLFDYQDFGIPVFHVFFMSYVSGHAIMSFYRLIKGCGKHNLIGFFFGIYYAISIVSRGTAMLIIIPCLLLYLTNSKSKKAILYAGIFLMTTIIGFGYMGDARFKSQGVTISNPIYQIGRINNGIAYDYVPSGFIWFYVYASSPYSNLINQERLDAGNQYGFSDFVVTSILPDFVAKRVKGDYQYKDPVLLTPELNVSTGYALPYLTLGEIGIIFMYLYFCVYVLVFTTLNHRRNLAVISSIFSSAGALLIFYNMLIFSTCFLQMIIITVLSRFKINGMRMI